MSHRDAGWGHALLLESQPAQQGGMGKVKGNPTGGKGKKSHSPRQMQTRGAA